MTILIVCFAAISQISGFMLNIKQCQILNIFI